MRSCGSSRVSIRVAIGFELSNGGFYMAPEMEGDPSESEGWEIWSAQAETEIDDAEIFAVDELDPNSGSITQSFDFESLSASVGAPIDLSN
jgi:hypothetical protein